MSEVDWDQRMIGIKGARGVGKTTFLLDYVREYFGTDKSCLYVNLNHLYFSERSIVSFADEFRKKGGKTLVLDQVNKYPNWAEELLYCYKHFKDLQIVYSCSSVIRLEEENSELSKFVVVYRLEGFSFREYLNLKTGRQYPIFSFDEVIANHERIASEIVSEVKPLAYFHDYLHHGYYPFLLSKRKNYLESLMKNINLTLEIDISYLKQVELKYLPKLRKLLYIVAQVAPHQPNVSRLSTEVATSRATIMNYLKYLREGWLINLLYEGAYDPMKKPDLIYLQNSNLVYSVFSGEGELGVLNKTFLYNQLSYRCNVNYSKEADFLVNGETLFEVGEAGQIGEDDSGKTIYANDMVEVGSKRLIPLWLFGFLY